MSGLTQYLIVAFSWGRRWTSVTYAPAIVDVRLRVIVAHVGQIFARHADEVGVIVVADGHQHVAGVPAPPDGARGSRLDREPIVLARDGQHGFVERNLQVVLVDHLAVVLQRLGACRFIVRRNERQTADFEQLGCREEHHLRWKAIDRVHQYALLEHLVVEIALFGGNRRGQAGRSGADDNQIPNGHGTIL